MRTFFFDLRSTVGAEMAGQIKISLTMRALLGAESSDRHTLRIKNLFLEIRSPDRIRGRRVLLIDDIFTTGTTVNEALKVLRAANPTSVDVLTLARTRPSE